ncbi:6,7-dimethyl-8-ribityllumazine synthase [Marinivivus vitaminiproducens]|uniref:6,7-dimethyl-8-ribityllumazine synthase n=1 Tax=Marinivivus vitaminiproducens TaxID=3035935 RepID=UPI0027991C8A|nr:6,7-dimethyl-8-ribityllumazine synthase [Geminicoccaceae bacterium SCSIO 64248]
MNDNDTPSKGEVPDGQGVRILIVEGRFYDDIGDHLVNGAKAMLRQAGAEHDHIIVPGALEIPVTIAMAADTGMYDAFVALGCVIRGETSHYDIVAGESARGLMDLALNDGILIGNGILTVETREQALVRADPARKDKGGDAVKAALSLLSIKEAFSGATEPE